MLQLKFPFKLDKIYALLVRIYSTFFILIFFFLINGRRSVSQTSERSTTKYFVFKFHLYYFYDLLFFEFSFAD